MMGNKTVTKIASITIGIVLAILIIILGFKLFQSVFTRAEDLIPQDVVVSDISENSAKLTWATAQETQGVVEYGTSPTALNFFAPEATKTKSHSVDLTLLSPGTTYYAQIRIGDKKYDNGGVPWTFTTKGTEQTLPSNPGPTSVVSGPSPTPISHLVIPAEGCSETDCTKIKEKLGQGCTTQDYFTCVRKLTPGASSSATAD